MSLTRKVESHILSKEEQELIARSCHPGLGMLPDVDVGNLRDLIFGYRNTAQRQSLEERKERRKAKPVPGKGTGIRIKTRALAAAATRINKEIARRRADAAKDII